jgi:hypothetical protein
VVTVQCQEEALRGKVHVDIRLLVRLSFKQQTMIFQSTAVPKKI